MLIEAFHDDGMNQFEARPDVTYEIIEGTLEKLAEKIADGVTICPRIRLLKPRNSAILGARLFTSGCRCRPEIPL